MEKMGCRAVDVNEVFSDIYCLPRIRADRGRRAGYRDRLQRQTETLGLKPTNSARLSIGGMPNIAC